MSCLQFVWLVSIDAIGKADMTMQTTRNRLEPARTGSLAGGGEQHQHQSRQALINIGPALDCSFVTKLFDRPYPVQFRNQGAIDAWTRALGKTDVWRRWQDPGTLCWRIRQDLMRQLETMHPCSPAEGRLIAQDCERLAVEASTNLKYHLSQGTVIEATPALESLLTNSDVDLALPMSLVVPPFSAQYLRFGETAMRYLKVPASPTIERVFDGVFCFLTSHAASSIPADKEWTLELVFISKLHDSYGGHISLLGDTDRDTTTVGDWLDEVLGTFTAHSAPELRQTMHAAVSYVVRVFLYMALKQARLTRHCEYDDALRRASGLGARKRAKLIQRSASLYDGIVVGPQSLPQSESVGMAGSSVAPHWRRGHFRLQPCGAGHQQRKLIFVAPVLVHADQLQGETPAPKPYRATTAIAA